MFAKQLERHIFGFPTKILTIRNHCQKKDICNSAEFSPSALIQISFEEIILRLPPLGPPCSRLAFLPRHCRWN